MKINEVIPTISPPNAYALIESARAGLDVSSLGLGASGHISSLSSLNTLITIESFCSLLALMILANEVSMLFFKRAYNSVGRNIYLLFRLATILASLAGIILVYSDISINIATSPKTAAGTIFIALALFSSHALTISKNATIAMIEDRRRDNTHHPHRRSTDINKKDLNDT